MSTKAPAVSNKPSISRRFSPLSMTCVSPVLRGLWGRSGTPRNPSSKPGTVPTIPNRSNSDPLFVPREQALVDLAQKLLDLIRARGLRVGEIPASLGRVGREPGEVALRHAELAQPGRAGKLRELLDATGGIQRSADRLGEARHGVGIERGI